ncbi:hypothetical protein HQ544_00410 [Candidatus Falkowbacteria bacterium]|nr:hypothetical protein [Candidatus Falkowbacteria bacterium]
MKKLTLLLLAAAVMLGGCGIFTSLSLWDDADVKEAKKKVKLAELRADSLAYEGRGRALNKKPFSRESTIYARDGSRFYSRVDSPEKLIKAKAELERAEGESAVPKAKADRLLGKGGGASEYYVVEKGIEKVKVGIRNMRPYKAVVRCEALSQPIEIPADSFYKSLWLVPGKYAVDVELWDGSTLVDKFSARIPVTSMAGTERSPKTVDEEMFATVWRIRWKANDEPNE